MTTRTGLEHDDDCDGDCGRVETEPECVVRRREIAATVFRSFCSRYGIAAVSP